MAPTRTDCPECGAGLKLPASFTPGRAITCPKCETRFVPGDAGGEDDDPPEKPAAGKKPGRAAADDDTGDAPKKPKKKKKKAVADDEDGWSYRTSWVRFAVLGVLVVVLGVLGYMLYQKNQREKEADRKPTGDADPIPKVVDDRVLAETDKGGKKGGQLNPKADPVAEAARKDLVGEWEYRADGGDVFTVRYTADGGFRYTAERGGKAEALTGRWAVTAARLADPKGAPPPRPTVVASVQWETPSKKGLRGDCVLQADRTLVHPLLDKFEPGAGKTVFVRKK